MLLTLLFLLYTAPAVAQTASAPDYIVEVVAVPAAQAESWGLSPRHPARLLIDCRGRHLNVLDDSGPEALDARIDRALLSARAAIATGAVPRIGADWTTAHTLYLTGSNWSAARVTERLLTRSWILPLGTGSLGASEITAAAVAPTCLSGEGTPPTTTAATEPSRARRPTDDEVEAQLLEQYRSHLTVAGIGEYLVTEEINIIMDRWNAEGRYCNTPGLRASITEETLQAHAYAMDTYAHYLTHRRQVLEEESATAGCGFDPIFDVTPECRDFLRRLDNLQRCIEINQNASAERHRLLDGILSRRGI